MSDILQQKKALRNRVSGLRDSLPLEFRQKFSSALAKHDCPFLEGVSKAVISFYMPIKSEIDPQFFMRKLEAKQHILCLPRMASQSKILEFRHYNLGDRLEEGKHGVLEPLPESQVIIPQIVLLPLLAVDMSGNRLGYGGGYYDLTLASLASEKEVVAVGLGYESQIVDYVPAENTDIKLDWLMTEEEVYQFSPSFM